MFSLQYKRVEGKHIRSIFGIQNERFLNLLNRSEALTDAEVRIALNDESNDYTLTSNPILSLNGEMIGKILILNEIKRAKTLVTKMIGARASLRFEDICGQNPRFLETINQAKMVSQSNSSILLLGKSGTGKDIIARPYTTPPRQNGPYVAINCAAIPRDLITSELFGHMEGSFTGSRRGGSQGKFELADGGTIFLDEIAETPLELQAVLLRVIEDKSVMRIGGEKVRPVDVRISPPPTRISGKRLRKEPSGKTSFTGSMFSPSRWSRFARGLTTSRFWSIYSSGKPRIPWAKPSVRSTQKSSISS
jgi:transcriptional regulator with PAS, ATPase and Fis domain